MTAVRVLAPVVLVRDEQGRTHHRYNGAVVDVVDADHAAYLLSEGMVAVVEHPQRELSADDGAAAGLVTDDGDQMVGRPPHVAAKARWVDYAVDTLGVDRADAEAMTKMALIAACSDAR